MVVKQVPAPVELLKKHGVELTSTNEFGLHLISVPAEFTLKQLGDFIVAANADRFLVRLYNGFSDIRAMGRIDEVGLRMIMEKI